MKNYINYYYNLSVSDLRKRDNKYFFEIDNFKYEFSPYQQNIEALLKTYLTIISSNRYTHEIIYNKDNSIFTLYENVPYVLIKKNYTSSESIDLKTITNYDIALNINYTLNWKNLWQQKMDYYEYQVKEIGSRYKNIKESFPYYLGLSELAISIINFINIREVSPYISHKRIIYKETYDTFLNPLNIIVDTRVRDIAEYLKINCIYGNLNIIEVLQYIDVLNLNKSEALLLLSRLIYPSYYFDIYDRIIKGEIDNTKIDFYIEKNVCYETFLKSLYKRLKFKYNIPIIDWFES